MAIIARPLHRVCERYLHRRRGAAGLLTVLLVLAFLAPPSIAVLSLTGGAIDLGRRLLQSKSGTDALRSLAVGGDGATLRFDHWDVKQWVEIARRHGAEFCRKRGRANFSPRRVFTHYRVAHRAFCLAQSVDLPLRKIQNVSVLLERDKPWQAASKMLQRRRRKRYRDGCCWWTTSPSSCACFGGP
jgi:hypothetical protein